MDYNLAGQFWGMPTTPTSHATGLSLRRFESGIRLRYYHEGTETSGLNYEIVLSAKDLSGYELKKAFR